MNETPLKLSLPAHLSERLTVSLNGMWQAESSYFGPGSEILPETFTTALPVPGLWDMAEGRLGGEAVWYKRSFVLAGELPARATLKINKAFWGKYIYLNGRHIADHHPNFSPAFIDLTDFLASGENTLVVKIGRVGSQNPELGHIQGYDLEKFDYIPGIYDDVSLIISGSPHIEHMQVAPSPKRGVALVQTTVVNGSAEPVTTDLSLIVRAADGRVAAEAVIPAISLGAGASETREVEIPLAAAHLWSPEEPYLYTLEAKTSRDSCETRFGMRSFRFDPADSRPMLNGRPYYLRGTNVTMFRFFEDPNRGSLPWDREWAREVLLSFKKLNMNAMRFSLGPPPELWYELADELGLLIQDEYPIWLELERLDAEGLASFAERVGIPRAPGNPLWWVVDNIPGKYPFFGDNLPPIENTAFPELVDWMREHANHPSVVVWDLQNESQSLLTEILIKKLREARIDLSERPFDNGWSPPASPTDTLECHPYLFKDPEFRLSNLAGVDTDPAMVTPFFYNYSRSADRSLVPSNPRIINEYGWLWLTRGGEPALASRRVWNNLLPGGSIEQYREYYAHAMAELTEFWRSGRKCAGIFYFPGLSYCKKEAMASDPFLPDISQPSYDAGFEKMMADAMAPIGICLEEWSESFERGEREVAVAVYNDTDEAWRGEVAVSIERANQPLETRRGELCVEAYGISRRPFIITTPEQEGEYCLRASYIAKNGQQICSRRKFRVARQ